MSIKYFGKTEIKEKINALLDEMLNDNEMTYTIRINEDRIDENIAKLQIELVDINNSIPNF